jgi:hypothetical protein
MRASAAVLRWLSPGIFALVAVLTVALPARADTGTYRILDYVTTLEPQSDGSVRITYEQTWQVLSGNIPWITAGLANASYSVQSWGGAATRVYSANSGGFVGVRADLDKTYLPGDTFSVSFVVLQNSLLEKLTSEKKWRVDFTPGWYDSAVISHLQIKLVSPVSLDAYSLVSPVATSSANGVITWERSNLAAGGRFEIKVECLDGSFLSASAAAAKKGPSPWPFVIGAIVVIGFIALIVVGVRRAQQARDAELKARIAATEQEMAQDKAKKEEVEKGFREYVIEKGMEPDAQGRYYDRGYGNYVTPAIWAAVILGQQQQRARDAAAAASGRAGGYSCACACVSCACACACACAGGGAAGCARKTLHECRECEWPAPVPARPIVVRSPPLGP